MPFLYPIKLSSRWEKIVGRERPRWLRYSAVAFLFSPTLALMPLLQHYHSIGVATLNLSGAILASVYGGLGPGLLASLLSALSVDYFLIEPVGQVLTTLQDFFFVGSYLLLSVFMSLIVSSLRQAYRNVGIAKNAAEKAVQERESVLAIVSHDLRNPVSSVALNCQLLRNSLDDRELVLKCAARIEQSTGQMDRLIQDLLDASRIGAGALRVACKTEDLATAAREAVASLEAIADRQSLSLFLEIDAAIPPLSFDRNRIIQVLSNLIGNAIKFTPAGGSIVVAVRRHGQGAEVSVRDTGPGIPKRDLARVFERHWQARETAQKGAGLGLFISRGIIEAHGGRIRAESAPGGGSVFSFTLAEQGGNRGLRQAARDQEFPALRA